MITKGYLIIADISGYTAFLTQAELEHAREILDDLLRTLLAHFKPPLVVSRLEGDGVFAYAPEGSFMQGQTLLEALEDLYFDFRKARDNIHRACQCSACSLTSTLDLKMVIHYGQFTLLTLGSNQELQGADVIVAHRLMKNSVVKTTGVKAYALFTEASAQALELGELTETMTPHAETYEHLGEVRGYVYDLSAAWEREAERRRVYIGPDEAWVAVEDDLPVPPPLAWDYLNHPNCVCEWCDLEDIQMVDLKWGRLGIGSGRHCVHAKGKGTTVETILDYQPFDYVTVESVKPNQIVVRTTTEITPSAGGSRVAWRASMPSAGGGTGLKVRAMSPRIKTEMSKEIKTSLRKLREMIEGELAAAAQAEQTPAAPPDNRE